VTHLTMTLLRTTTGRELYCYANKGWTLKFWSSPHKMKLTLLVVNIYIDNSKHSLLTICSMHAYRPVSILTLEHIMLQIFPSVFLSKRHFKDVCPECSSLFNSRLSEMVFQHRRIGTLLFVDPAEVISWLALLSQLDANNEWMNVSSLLSPQWDSLVQESFHIGAAAARFVSKFRREGYCNRQWPDEWKNMSDMDDQSGKLGILSILREVISGSFDIPYMWSFLDLLKIFSDHRQNHWWRTDGWPPPSWQY
jgi:hypothetical protein